MDLYKLIQALEKLVFEVASWLVFIPLTFVLTVFRPDRIHAYTHAEFERPVKQRFQTRLSSPLLWVLVGVLPAFVTLELSREFFSTPEGRSVLDNYILPGWSIEAKVFALSLALLSGPIAFAVATRLVQGKSLTRAGLEPEFFAQCYVFAPFQLFLSITVLVILAVVVEAIVHAVTAGLGGGSRRSSVWSGPSGDLLIWTCLAVTLLWFLIAQCFYFAHAFAGAARTIVKRVVLVSCGFLVALLLWAAMAGAWLLSSELIVNLLPTIVGRESKTS